MAYQPVASSFLPNTLFSNTKIRENAPKNVVWKRVSDERPERMKGLAEIRGEEIDFAGELRRAFRCSSAPRTASS